MKNEDKGKSSMHDESFLMGVKPFGNIGPDNGIDIVGKLKKKKTDSLLAKGSTSKSGEEANVGKVSTAIGSFVNR